MAPLSRLQESVDHLHEQLATAEHLGDVERQSLESLLGEVARVLDREDEESPEPEGLADQLRDVAEDFEEAHPVLTHALGRVIDALSSLGI